MIELYHGSNIEIDKIDLKKGRLGKDFGQGFYLSENKSQALKMAQTAVDREETGYPTVTTYLFDESLLHTHDALNVKIFEGYSKEWAQFVFLNRANKTESQAHDFDVESLRAADSKNVHKPNLVLIFENPWLTDLLNHTKSLPLTIWFGVMKLIRIRLRFLKSLGFLM